MFQPRLIAKFRNQVKSQNMEDSAKSYLSAPCD